MKSLPSNTKLEIIEELVPDELANDLPSLIDAFHDIKELLIKYAKAVV